MHSFISAVRITYNLQVKIISARNDLAFGFLYMVEELRKDLSELHQMKSYIRWTNAERG